MKKKQIKKNYYNSKRGSERTLNFNIGSFLTEVRKYINNRNKTIRCIFVNIGRYYNYVLLL